MIGDGHLNSMPVSASVGDVNILDVDLLDFETGSAAPAPAPTPTPTSPHVGLAVGSNGSLVKDLQRALINTGLTLRGGADGVFGSATKATLILFQQTNGTPQTGVVSEKDASVLALGGDCVLSLSHDKSVEPDRTNRKGAKTKYANLIGSFPFFWFRI